MEGANGGGGGDGGSDGGDRPWQSYHTVYTTAKAGLVPFLFVSDL